VQGSRFVFESCDSQLPGGAVPLSEHGYSDAFSTHQDCAAPGGAIGLVESQPAAATFGILYVSIPPTPGGFVETETITAVKSGIEAGNALHYSHINEDGFPGPAPEETRIFPLRGEPRFLGWNGGYLQIEMSCDGNVGPCGPGPILAAHYIAATEVDPNPPSVGALSGSALSGAVLRGHQTLGAEAADEGGGLTGLSALVNGLPAAPAVSGPCAVARVSNRSTYGTVAYSPTPCPPRLKGAWTLDTSAYPFHDGANTIAVCASDFATLGNPTTCSAAQTVTVDNSCTESPVAGGSEIAAGFAQTNTETVTVGFGAAAEVTGSLRDGAGEPAPGATICVKAQTLESGEPQAPVAAVKTDAEGRFAYAVPAGPRPRGAEPPGRPVEASQRRPHPPLGRASRPGGRRPGGGAAGKRQRLAALDHLPPRHHRRSRPLQVGLPLPLHHPADDLPLPRDRPAPRPLSLRRRPLAARPRGGAPAPPAAPQAAQGQGTQEAASPRPPKEQPMRKLAARRPSPALMVAFVALAVAVVGQAWAAPTKTKTKVVVRKGQIAKGAVTARSLAQGSVRAKALAAGAVHPMALAQGAVGAAAIRPGSVGASALAPDAVTGGALAPGSVYGAAPGEVTLHSAAIVDADMDPALAATIS
jgi:hypothetical protein